MTLKTLRLIQDADEYMKRTYGTGVAYLEKELSWVTMRIGAGYPVGHEPAEYWLLKGTQSLLHKYREMLTGMEMPQPELPAQLVDLPSQQSESGSLFDIEQGGVA